MSYIVEWRGGVGRREIGGSVSLCKLAGTRQGSVVAGVRGVDPNGGIGKIRLCGSQRTACSFHLAPRGRNQRRLRIGVALHLLRLPFRRRSRSRAGG